MRQMNQSVGVGAEAGFRSYGYNDNKTWANLTRYGTFDATYRAVDLNLTGKLFFSRNSVRPFLGVLVGGELATWWLQPGVGALIFIALGAGLDAIKFKQKMLPRVLR